MTVFVVYFKIVRVCLTVDMDCENCENRGSFIRSLKSRPAYFF